MSQAKVFTTLVAMTALVSLAAGCKKDEDAGKPAGDNKPAATAAATAAATFGSPTGTSPTKELAVQTLRDLYAALEAKDYDKAATFFPTGFTGARSPAGLAKVIDSKEISPAGIDIIAAQGKWGKLAEVFTPERAKAWAEKAKVPADECYGLSHNGGEAGFHWTGSQFLVVRCDDIGKLK